MLGKRHRINVEAQRLCSDKLGDVTERCGRTGSAHVGHLDDNARETRKKGNNHVLESLGSVVTYGVPPLSSLIWSRVSLKSLPATAPPPLEEAAGVTEEVAGASTIGRPSRSAFSRAAFSARAFLSASIWALTAALAFASLILSVRA
jgi:hypothetical protein